MDTPAKLFELASLTDEARSHCAGSPACSGDPATGPSRAQCNACVTNRRLIALSPSTGLSVAGAFTTAHRQLGVSAQRCYLALGLQPRTGRASADALAEALAQPFYEVAEGLAELRESYFIEEIGDDRYIVSNLVALHASSLDNRPDEDKAAETEWLLSFHHQSSYDADALLAPARPWRRMFLPALRSRGGGGRPVVRPRARPLTVLVKHAYERVAGHSDLVLARGA